MCNLLCLRLIWGGCACALQVSAVFRESLSTFYHTLLIKQTHHNKLCIWPVHLQAAVVAVAEVDVAADEIAKADEPNDDEPEDDDEPDDDEPDDDEPEDDEDFY